MQRDPSAVSLEKFVLNSLSSIAQETSGRRQAQKDVREAAIKLLEELGVAEFGKPGSRLSVPFPPDVTSQLLGVLRGALALGNPRLADPALSCMHKLVAYAYLQGETGPSGRLDDDNNVVTQVVAMTAKCGESSSAATQLQLVKALLTYVTAEHFMAHGDVLMQAVRAVFNTAIGADSADIQSTARSALLQMVNTVLKRVGQQILSANGTPLPSPSPSVFLPQWSKSSNSDMLATAANAAMAAVAADHASSSRARGPGHNDGEGKGGSGNGEAEGSRVSPVAEQTGAEEGQGQPLSPTESGMLRNALFREMSVSAAALSAGASPETLDSIAAAAAASVSGSQQPQHSPRPTASADVEGAADVAALAADMAELQAALPRIHTSPPTPTCQAAEAAGAGAPGSALAGSTGDAQMQEQHGESDAASAEQFVAAAVEADARTAQLATLAEQSDLWGLERALDNLPQAEPSGVAQHKVQLSRQDTPPDPRRALMRDRRAAAWKMLTPVEKDALIVLTAMSKMAARETGIGAVESFMHQGKLLALDLLVRVLTNPMHDWAHMRPEFAAELRHPLCLVLLRNCTSPYDPAVTAAVRLFEAILSAQKLRAGLKAELGALYPLLLLKPIEAMVPDSAHAVVMAAEGVLHVCSHPQVLVDLFVNYDCSLQAANLYERTIKAVRKLMALQDSNAPFNPAITQKLKATAQKALLAAIASLDTWAGPIKSAAAAVALTPEAVAAATAGGDGGDAGSGSERTPASQLPRDREELQRILADKELKDALLSGIQAFNQNPVKGLRLLVQSGVVPDGSPAAAARFLREHAARLDKAQIGELMGHHEEHSIQVMHCYIDGERYCGLTLDEALRQLLANFRLPGEAQKIDRIMEKFAERYCRDNPQAFKTADGAYLLAFAIIMLNTDAHNPMADRRISPDDFVSMAQCQVESNGSDGEPCFEQILPTQDLLDIYARITQTEIKVAGEEKEAAAVPGNSKQHRGGVGGSGDKKAESSRRAKLAAAVGMTQMVLPFWSGATWDKQHGVDVERKRLLEFTRQMLASSGAVAGNLWHTATHAEHARPMMQVSGDAFLQCLKLGLEAAPNMPAALQILGAYEQAVRLAALLRLESICEALVVGLAAAAGLADPAPHSSAAEAKQVAALSKLVSLGSCSEAGMLGSSWLVLLRALSQLERLQAVLLPGSKNGLPPLPEGAAAMLASSSLDAAAAAAAAAASPPPAQPQEPQSSSGFGRLLQRMGLAGSSSSSGDASSGSGTAAGGRLGGLLDIKDAPGAGHVLWAETAGVAPIERLFTNSASLHGDSVLSFMRALCAVSQEELQPTSPGERPRVALLQRVVECAYHNMGRIRLVWSRLWNVVAQHLVSAACHTDAYVAMYAVDALRQLAAKLLDRAELARFTHQGEALRPFAAVLRHSDSPAVRELAVACVAHAASAHPRGLGSGWRSVLEALALAGRDASPAVVSQSLDAMQPVVEALFRPSGHAQLRECVVAVLAGVENPHGFEELSIGALYLFQALARRLQEAVGSGEADDVLLMTAAHGSSSASPPHSRQREQQQQAQPSSPTSEQQETQQQQEDGDDDLTLAPGTAVPSHSGSRQAEVGMEVGDPAGTLQPLPPHQQQLATAAVDSTVAAWQVLLVPLAAVARLDARPRVADAAAAVLLQIFRRHGDSLAPEQWQRLFGAVLLPLMAMPVGHGNGTGDRPIWIGNGSTGSPNSISSTKPTAAPVLVLGRRSSGAEPAEAAASRRSTLAAAGASGGAADSLLAAVPAALSFEGLDRLERHVSAHMPELRQMILGQADPDPSASATGTSAAAEEEEEEVEAARGNGSGEQGQGRLQLLWQPLLCLLEQYICFPAESAAVLGVNQLHHLLLAAAPLLDASCWQAAVATLQAVSLRDSWAPDQPAAETAAAAPAGLPPPLAGSSRASNGRTPPAAAGAAEAAESMRRRSRLAVLLQRVVDSLLLQRRAAMPGQVQLQLLELLHRTVMAASAITASPACRSAAEQTLAAAATPWQLGSVSGKQLDGMRAAWMLAADARAAGGAAAGGMGMRVESMGDLNEDVLDGGLPVGTAPLGDGGDMDDTAGLAAPWEQLRPALARQEAEGGCLYIAALQRCVLDPAASDGTAAAVAAECETRLASFCLWVVAGAAERVGPTTTIDAQGTPAEDAFAATTAALAAALAASPGVASSLGTPAGFSAPNPADQSWEDAVRAPLVDAALQAYASLSPPVWSRQQAAAFPHLAQLVCSPSRPVRKALQALLRQHVPSVLAATTAG